MGRGAAARPGGAGGGGVEDLEALWPARARPAWRAGVGRRPAPRPGLGDGRRAGLAGAGPCGRPGGLFDPLDAQRALGGAARAPRLAVPQPAFPPFLSIMKGLAGLVARHPRTTFIGAHVGCYAENLAGSGAARPLPEFLCGHHRRIGELGRQPYTARRFFLKYADRILFGSTGAVAATYRMFYRFLETDDEFFNYNAAPVPLQGRWQIYGLFLPDDVLRKRVSGQRGAVAAPRMMRDARRRRAISTRTCEGSEITEAISTGTLSHPKIKLGRDRVLPAHTCGQGLSAGSLSVALTWAQVILVPDVRQCGVALAVDQPRRAERPG